MTYKIETSSYGSAGRDYHNFADKAYEDISRSRRGDKYAGENNTQNFENSIPLSSFPVIRI